jgi:hypothetical protein
VPVDQACTLTIDDAKSVTAAFDGPRTLALAVTSFNGGSGFISAQTVPYEPNGGFDCAYPGQPSCEHTYTLGTVVQIQAIANPTRLRQQRRMSAVDPSCTADRRCHDGPPIRRTPSSGSIQ